MNRGKLTEYEENLKRSIANNLRALLKAKKMTQKRLGEVTGIPTSTISDYLSAKSLAVPGNIQKISLALGVSKEKIDPSFGDSELIVSTDQRKMMFFAELEKELGIDLSDENVQKSLKRAAKIAFSTED